MVSVPERRAYQRGYQRGARWPEHRPPTPPHPIIAKLVTALQELRDATDTGCATFSPDDEFVVALSPYIDKANEALIEMSRWLKSVDDAGRGEER